MLSKERKKNKLGKSGSKQTVLTHKTHVNGLQMVPCFVEFCFCLSDN